MPQGTVRLTSLGWRALVVAIALLLVSGSTAVAVDPLEGSTPHAIADGVIDTPLEGDQAHDAGTAGPQTQRATSGQHGEPGGHLPASSANVELVGQLTLSNVEPGQISDVAQLGDFAYLGSYTTPNCDKGGFYTVDISNPAHPTEVSFTSTAPGSFVSEGMQAIPLATSAFTGDILVINNEICDDTSGLQIGGFSLYDVTDPRHISPLVLGAGDTVPGGFVSAANQIHSTFAWQQGKRAFVVIVDDEESTDVDIFEITNPRAPVQIAEVSLADWPGAQNAQADGIGNFAASFLHDMTVKKIGSNWLMLASYWDAGYIILNVNDPAHPVFVNDTDYLDPDPLTGLSPEGNAHYAEFSADNRFVLATDEDFAPYRLDVAITSGAFAGGHFKGSQGDGTPQINATTSLVGPTTFVGRACNGSLPPPAPSADAIAVAERGTCTFTEKVTNASAAGYAGLIVFNNETSSPNCEGLVSPSVDGNIPMLFVARSTGFKILGIAGYNPANCPGGANPALPAPGTAGSSVSITAVFDGWGYVRLFDRTTLQELGQYAVPESLNPAFASGFGALSVHEVATDPDENRAYISYYDAGFRVVEFGRNGIQEVGHYIAPNGNDFWGVQVVQSREGDQNHTGNHDRLVLASDRDSGLWIFRYTGGSNQSGLH